MHKIESHFEDSILRSTGASSLHVGESIQELWSGYGKILRIELAGTSADTVIVKHVRTPNAANHPRGWNSNLSHQRKVKSYKVETAFYQDYSQHCGDGCRIPRFIAFDQHDGESLIVLEDLDAAGYPERLQSVTPKQIEICLQWLANFHATFLGHRPDRLWETGTYWHLETRPDELEVLDDLELKAAASQIDQQLKGARFQTLVHGDAKLANFCFSSDGQEVAAVDFQYVGGGCGMKDVAYFIGSCVPEHDCGIREKELLDIYFSALRVAIDDQDPEPVISEWRDLYHLAWTDFHRFLKGWSPGHWKINSYSERVAKQVLEKLQ